MSTLLSPTPNEQRRARFETDRNILRELLPGIRHLVLTGTDWAIAEGAIDVDAGAGRFERVEIEMRFAPGYPAEPPRVWDRRRRWIPHPDRHINEDGEFCLGLPGVDLPVTDTPKDFEHFLDQLLVFLHDQFVFDALGHWTGPQWEHGFEAAYTQFAAETLGIETPDEARALGSLIVGRRPRPHDRCPCRSRLAYSRCHANRVDRVRAVQQLRRVPDIVERLVARTRVA